MVVRHLTVFRISYIGNINWVTSMLLAYIRSNRN
nr:MAG TPA: hypothetical protein [Caudoviricetes sp.]